MSDLIDTKQVELHFEKANMAAEMVERGKGFVLLGAITAGKELIAAKELCGHGNFTAWLQQNWNHSQSLANKYMRIANSERVTNLSEAKSIREALALSMVSEVDSEEEQPSQPVSGRVKVSKPADTERDPAPKTNTKHTAENRKANPAKQPATRTVSAQAELISAVKLTVREMQIIEQLQSGKDIIDVLCQEDSTRLLEACSRRYSVNVIVREIINSTAPQDVLDVASQLRKAADTLDPPKKPTKAGAVPTAAELHEAIPADFPDDLYETCRQWATYKQGRAKGERIQSQDAWKIALKQIWNYAESNGVDLVIEMIEKAIANSWKGWNHGSGTSSTGTTSGKAAAASATQRREQANASAFDHIRRAAAAQRAAGSDQG